MAEGLSSRLCALNSLLSVFEGGNPLDIALDKNAAKLSLSQQDKSFTHALCGYALRYKPTLQTIINEAANRHKDVTPQAVNIILLIGVAQFYFMNVPDHAIVDVCVELTKKTKNERQSGLVNAILRRIMREGKTGDIKPSLPSWLVNSWRQDYDNQIAKEIEKASLSQAKTGITNKDGTWRLAGDHDDLRNMPDDIWVQDYASYLPVTLLGDLHDKTVLDLCAAPGGKTMQLASAGATVTSVDISQKRLSRLQDNLKRTKLTDSVEVVCADIFKFKPQQSYDVVLLDAPCSATGTIRRHPDLPYIRTSKDIKDLEGLQRRLLDQIKDWVKPNGLLCYCTCSLQKNEGEDQISQFLKTNENYKRVEITQHKNVQTTEGDIRILPTHGDMDGFFISILQKSD